MMEDWWSYRSVGRALAAQTRAPGFESRSLPAFCSLASSSSQMTLGLFISKAGVVETLMDVRSAHLINLMCLSRQQAAAHG